MSLFKTIFVEELEVTNPLVLIGTYNDNPVVANDTYDIGVFGQYSDGTELVYTGLFRDATDSDRTWRLFDGLQDLPGVYAGNVYTSGTGYADASLLVKSFTTTGPNVILNSGTVKTEDNVVLANAGPALQKTDTGFASYRIPVNVTTSEGPKYSAVAVQTNYVSGTTLLVTHVGVGANFFKGWLITDSVASETRIVLASTNSGTTQTLTLDSGFSNALTAGTDTINMFNHRTVGIIFHEAYDALCAFGFPREDLENLISPDNTNGNLADWFPFEAGNITANGTLSVTGNLTAGNASITSNLSAGNSSVSGSSTVTGNLTAGNASITSNLSAGNSSVSGNSTTGNLAVTSNTTTGNITVSSNLTAGNASVTSNLSAGNSSVSGNSTTGNLAVTSNTTTGNISVTSNVTAGNISVTSNLAVTGNTTLSNVHVTGDEVVDGNLFVYGNTNVGNTTIGNLTVTGNTILEGNTTILGNVFVTEASMVNTITFVPTTSITAAQILSHSVVFLNPSGTTTYTLPTIASLGLTTDTAISVTICNISTSTALVALSGSDVIEGDISEKLNRRYLKFTLLASWQMTGPAVWLIL